MLTLQAIGDGSSRGSSFYGCKCIQSKINRVRGFVAPSPFCYIEFSSGALRTIRPAVAFTPLFELLGIEVDVMCAMR